MPQNSAEYMRAYRARKKAEHAEAHASSGDVLSNWIKELQAENAALIEEVARLKRRLAAGSKQIVAAIERTRLDTAFEVGPNFRPNGAYLDLPARDPIRDPMHEFHPVPKPGKRK